MNFNIEFKVYIFPTNLITIFLQLLHNSTSDRCPASQTTDPTWSVMMKLLLRLTCGCNRAALCSLGFTPSVTAGCDHVTQRRSAITAPAGREHLQWHHWLGCVNTHRSERSSWVSEWTVRRWISCNYKCICVRLSSAHVHVVCVCTWLYIQ